MAGRPDEAVAGRVAPVVDQAVLDRVVLVVVDRVVLDLGVPTGRAIRRNDRSAPAAWAGIA